MKSRVFGTHPVSFMENSIIFFIFLKPSRIYFLNYNYPRLFFFWQVMSGGCHWKKTTSFWLRFVAGTADDEEIKRALDKTREVSGEFNLSRAIDILLGKLEFKGKII